MTKENLNGLVAIDESFNLIWAIAHWLK